MSRSGKTQEKRKLRAKVVAKKMARQSSKERTKVAAELLKLQQLGVVSTRPDLSQEVRATRDGLNNLIQGFNKNSTALANAIANLDARIGALMLVGDDMAALLPEEQTGVTLYATEDGTRKVHWEAYIKHYVDNVRALAMRVNAPSVPEEPSEPQEDLIVFGGNHEASTNG